MNYNSYRYTLFIGLFFASILAGCKKEEKILQKEEKQNITGTWYSNKIQFSDLLNGTSAVNADYEDYKPRIIESDLDDLPSQIRFNNDGSYTSISHRLGIYFALVGNEKDKNYANGGVWQFASEGTKLYFDKGIYEFEGSNPRYLDVLLLSPDSLKMETSEPKAVYDWAKLNGRSITLLDDFTNISNTCSALRTLGGSELAAKYATYYGYLDAAKDQPVDFNPFGLGLRKGAIQQFEALYKSFQKNFPIADSCYQANFDSNYNKGFAQAESQIQNYKFRTQKLTFILSRTPNAE